MQDKVYAIDANVILRYVTQEGGDLQQKAERILDAVAEGRLTVSCDPVVLAEVVWVLESFYGLSTSQIAVALEPFLQCDYFIMPEKQRYQRALQLYATAVPDYGDACASAMALEDCDGRLLSFDRKLSRVEGIQRLESEPTINPNPTRNPK